MPLWLVVAKLAARIESMASLLTGIFHVGTSSFVGWDQQLLGCAGPPDITLWAGPAASAALTHRFVDSPGCLAQSTYGGPAQPEGLLVPPYT
jgi:hypothetical protein